MAWDRESLELGGVELGRPSYQCLPTYGQPLRGNSAPMLLVMPGARSSFLLLVAMASTLVAMASSLLASMVNLCRTVEPMPEPKHRGV